ncbi:hypothetical protein DU506_07290 [Vreelandella rituensis]|uniref:Penicillin-binding protein activator LpoB n=2 Tax=Vreelandella rituensis TaxID=2282306 RepID=A0A368U6G8_9GAMM|nr:hypothetical protein DU506_07290 [Halomonas rituensis]
MLLTLVLLSGCAVTDVHRGDALQAQARWIQLPIANYAETPLAGQRAESILATLLHSQGIASLGRYAPSESGGLLDFNADSIYQEALDSARSEGYRYGVTGAVEEWQYKAGLDGEPAVGISLRVVDIASGDTLWSASGARTGWGYSTASGTAQKLMADMIGDLPVQK